MDSRRTRKCYTLSRGTSPLTPSYPRSRVGTPPGRSASTTAPTRIVTSGRRSVPPERPRRAMGARTDKLVPTLPRGHAARTLRVHNSANAPSPYTDAGASHQSAHAERRAREPTNSYPRSRVGTPPGRSASTTAPTRIVTSGRRSVPPERPRRAMGARTDKLVPTLPRGHAARTLRVHNSANAPSPHTDAGASHQSAPSVGAREEN